MTATWVALHDGVRRLMVAVLLQAVSDAREGDVNAAWWLRGEGEALVSALGITGLHFTPDTLAALNTRALRRALGDDGR